MRSSNPDTLLAGDFTHRTLRRQIPPQNLDMPSGMDGPIQGVDDLLTCCQGLHMSQVVGHGFTGHRQAVPVQQSF